MPRILSRFVNSRHRASRTAVCGSARRRASLRVRCDPSAMAQILEGVARRLGDNYPYFHPLYAGQMLKPPHPVARAAYALAMTINPNNHARDGGRASSEMEIEAVREIAGVFGWTEFLGHLTSSGTLANLEALWVAGQLAPGKRIVGSEQAHYTHQRISAVLKLNYAPIAADHRGCMSMDALETELRKGDVGTVVVTLGSTAIGAVDRWMRCWRSASGTVSACMLTELTAATSG